MSLTLYPSYILKLNKLCLPSKLYLAFSIIILLFSLFSQSIFNIIKFGIIIAFWTWNLNIICKAGYKNITWVLLVFTFIMAFYSTAEPFEAIAGGAEVHNPLQTVYQYKQANPTWTFGSNQQAAYNKAIGDGWTKGMNKTTFEQTAQSTASANNWTPGTHITDKINQINTALQNNDIPPIGDDPHNGGGTNKQLNGTNPYLL